jgi:hypothetical protein
MAIAFAFQAEWSRMLTKGKIKAVPKGMANHIADDDDEEDIMAVEAESDDDDDDEDDSPPADSANLTRDKVTAMMVCLVCGGLGHASRVDGVGECLTRKLGVEVSRSSLQAITYPSGIRRPILKSKPRSRTTPRATPYRSKSPGADANAAGPSRRKFPPKHPKPKPYHTKKGKARQVEDVTPNPETQQEPQSDSSEGVEYEFEELAVRFADIEA